MVHKCPICPLDAEPIECVGQRNRSACEALRSHPEKLEASIRAASVGVPDPAPNADPDAAKAFKAMQAQPRTRGPCAYLGGAVLGDDGTQALRECQSCGGNVREKLFSCNHPGHAADPTTTHRQCLRCPDWAAAAERRQHNAADNGTLPISMVAPSQWRESIYRGGILQIHVTRACDLSCFHCTQGSNLGGKPVMMTPEQFDAACVSLKGYFGVVGVFGGNPCVHPQFDELCVILKAHFPFEQRGLWSNNLRGKGAHARTTFNPKHSNFNVHLSGEAYDEFVRDWPESVPYLKGKDEDSKHGSPWVSMRDLGIPEDERWSLIEQCEINRFWSAMIGVFRGELRAWFCEIAGAQSMLHQDNPDWAGTGQPIPDTGLKVEPGWWQNPMRAFEHQVRTHCHECSIPLRRDPQLAVGGEREEFSKTHEYIARPKVKGRTVEIVSIGGKIERGERTATDYLPNTTPKVRA